MSLASKLNEQANTLFNGNEELFSIEIEARVAKRTDIDHSNASEMSLARQSAFNEIKQEWINEHLHNARVLAMMNFLDLYNSNDQGAMTEAMFEALCRTHKTIQAEFFTCMVKMFEKVAKADPRFFDGRNQVWGGIAERITWAYFHPDLMDEVMKKRT